MFQLGYKKLLSSQLTKCSVQSLNNRFAPFNPFSCCSIQSESKMQYLHIFMYGMNEMYLAIGGRM